MGIVRCHSGITEGFVGSRDGVEGELSSLEPADSPLGEFGRRGFDHVGRSICTSTRH